VAHVLVVGQDRSVMPWSVAGSTRTTIDGGLCGSVCCKRRMNVELLVTVSDEGAVNGSLFFVHTARRYLRWGAGRAGDCEACVLDWIKVVTWLG